MPSAIGRISRRISSRSRAASVLLVGVLLAGVLVATIGAGYTVSRPSLDDGGAYAAKANTVTYINAESRKVESEARALATGDNPIETVTLADGRVAVVDKKANMVWIIDGATMTPEGPPIDHPDAEQKPRPADEVVVVPAPDSGYVGSGDVVTQIGPDGQQKKPVKLPAKIVGASVPDAVEGIWVLIDGGKVAYVVGDDVRRAVHADRPIKFLTVADGRPFGVTDKGDLLDVSAQPLRRVETEPVPHGDAVQVGSAKGAGRWILVLDRAHSQLVAIDPRIGARQTFTDLPGQNRLGQPVQVGDRVYVPDYSKHLLYVRDVRSGQSLPDIEVPGESEEFALEVRDGRVWANDQFDRRTVVVGQNGAATFADKGDAPGLTDTSNPDPEQPEEPTQPEQDSPRPPESSSPPQPGPHTDAGPMVEVPVIEPGSDVDEACRHIRDARLTCVPVAVGDGGQTDTVADDDPIEPPAGTRVPESSRIVVRHYGPTTVPNVVGQYTDNACKLITDTELTCVKHPRADVAPTPESLDVVTDQSPGAGDEASTGSNITISYYDKATLADYHNQPGADACAALKQTYRAVGCQVVEGATEQATGLSAGIVYVQQPDLGAIVQTGAVVTLTVVTGSPHRVPDVTNQSPENACLILQQNGLGCDARADQLARHRVVVAQDTPPGTPVDGGTVVIHYAPYEPVMLSLYAADNGDPVYLLREDGHPGDRYSTKVADLGWGYKDQTEQSGMIRKLYDHFCANNDSSNKCLGFERNHYSTTTDVIYHDQWKVQGDPSVISACGPGMVAIYRGMNRPQGPAGPVHRYKVITEQELGAWEWTEPLGCLWPLGS